ncbi:hypothetical protein HN51_003980 [Arachis hypogaea]|nr:14 kDa proline-rich protein DC2.15-like [Arachis hypogaea]QHO37535.1 14 kDa proline-rich protein [Arachis hypogaea]
MGSKKAAMASTAALLLSLNLFFSTIVTSQQEPPPPPPPSCSPNTIMSSGCLTALNDTIGIGGPSPSSACCSILGVVNVDAAVCVCSTIKASGLNAIPNDTAAAVAVVSACNLAIPPGFQC